MQGALDSAQLRLSDLVALGIANQRESTIVWDRATGDPVHNAINWQDTRTDQLVRELAATSARIASATSGLPLATYFSGPKLRWLLDTIDWGYARAPRRER